LGLDAFVRPIDLRMRDGDSGRSFRFRAKSDSGRVTPIAIFKAVPTFETIHRIDDGIAIFECQISFVVDTARAEDQFSETAFR
jgi:hypothetical protein